ncbi:BTB POZ domain-containing protein [Rutstroemia sp. NJR-2017a BBW]|nr:BTB POZ domain-containing protein [Rutstroemia sp. NJR-2017a BBW]
MLCETIPYFDKMFNSSFREGQEFKASFPEDTPESFDVLLGWVYFGRVRRISNKDSPRLITWNAFHVYSLADKLCLPEVMDSIIDVYITWMATNGLLLNPVQVSDGFYETPAGSPFQRYLCHMLHYTIDTYPNGKLHKKFSIVDMDEVLEVNPGLRLELLKRMMRHPSGASVEDPRKLKKCKFHHHKENEPCPQRTAARFGFETVDLHVGPASGGKVFRVHKKILCDKIPYFSKMFNSGFAEAKDNSASFPEDRVDAFDHLLEWVYTGVLRRHIYELDGTQRRGENWNFLPFYMLAEKLCLPQLQDAAMDMLRASQVASNVVLGLGDITGAYEHTQGGSSYRLYALHSLLFGLCITGDKALEKWKNKDVVEMLKTCPDMAMDYVTMVRTHLRQTPLTKPVDPRIGDACVYHSHKIDEQCLLKPKKAEATAKSADHTPKKTKTSGRS